jgi:sugar (pentulose or hexulose) kinase
MESIFEQEVIEILKLIQDQINLLKERDELPLDAIFVVGGFSNSGYLMARISKGFSSQVEHIFRPPVPGSAVVQGAVALGCFRLSKVLSVRIEAQEQSNEQHMSAGAKQQAAQCSASVARN